MNKMDQFQELYKAVKDFYSKKAAVEKALKTNTLKAIQDAAADEDAEIRRVVAGSPRIRTEFLKAFVKDPDWTVRAAAARNSMSGREVLTHFSYDEDHRVRSEVLGNLNVTADIVTRLAGDANEIVQQRAIDHERLPRAVLMRMVEELIPAAEVSVFLRYKIANMLTGSPGATEEVIMKLSTNNDPAIRRIVADGRCSKALARLADDANITVVSAVAYNMATPTDVLSGLASHPESDVRSLVAKNLSTLSADLELLGEDKEDEVAYSVYMNPSTSAELRQKLAKRKIEITFEQRFADEEDHCGCCG